MRPSPSILLIVVVAAYVANASCGGGDDLPVGPSPVCSLAISPSEAGFASSGGTGSVAVNVASGCTWTATANAGWIVISAGNSGNGPGTISYSVDANSAVQSRSGVVTVGGRSHSISQQGRPAAVCSYTLSPEAATFDDEGGSRTFAVSTAPECGWTASSTASWVVVNAVSHGPGSGQVSYTVAANNEPVERSATIIVADLTFAIRQGGEPVACQYSVSPIEFNPCMPGGSVTVTLTTQASCAWTAAPDASWLNLPSGTSGTGSSVITIRYSDNYDAPRQGTVMVRWPTPTAGQNVRVVQAGCRYAVSQASFDFTFSGGNGSFTVIQQSDPTACGGATQDRCVWTAVSDVPWVTITSSMPRAGDNPVAFAVASNDGAAGRVGHVTVRDNVVTITQGRR